MKAPIAQRLRLYADGAYVAPDEVLHEAADTIHDLLSALRGCADYLDCIPESSAGGDDDAVTTARRARAAIKKATGEA